MIFVMPSLGWVTSGLLQMTSVSMVGSFTVATNTSAPSGELETKTPLKPICRAAFNWSLAWPLTMAQMTSGLEASSLVITGVKSVVPQVHFSSATTCRPLAAASVFKLVTMESYPMSGTESAIFLAFG